MLWPDPTDQSKLKPQYLKGTPANKFCTYIFIGFTVVVLGGFNLIWYIPYFDRKLKRIVEKFERTNKERDARELFRDPMIQNAIARKVRENEQDPLWYQYLK